MTRTEVNSSNIAAIGYDSATQTLEVEFHGKGGLGAVWQYGPVPQDVYASMLLPGASVGSVFIREVKANPLVTGVRVLLEDEATA